MSELASLAHRAAEPRGIEPVFQRHSDEMKTKTFSFRSSLVEIILEGVRYIDEIMIYDTEADLYEYLRENAMRIGVRIVGADWRGKPFTGHDLPIAVYFNTRDHGYSSSDLRRRIVAATSKQNGTL